MAKNDTIDASVQPEGGKKPAGRPAKKKAFKKRGEKPTGAVNRARTARTVRATAARTADVERSLVALNRSAPALKRAGHLASGAGEA
jgi:hypothetical protein